MDRAATNGIGRTSPTTPDHPDGVALRITLLGGFRVLAGGVVVPEGAWRRRKAAQLVKLLALAPGHTLHREELLDRLWPDLDPEAAGNNLRGALHAARRALDGASPGAGAALLLAGERVALRPAGPLEIDVAEFEVAAAATRRAPDPAAYEAALALYGGELLPEDRYEDWAAARREALAATSAGLILEAARLHEARGELAVAAAALERLTAREPAHEEAGAGLMRLHARRGERALALRQYALLREALRRELDAEPEPATQRLHAAILAGRLAPADGPPPLAAPVTPPPAAPPRPPRHNLPVALTSFVGREGAARAVREALAESRLVTLTGAGGSGKTRLALAVAEELVESYADGVWLVELAPLEDPALLPGTVAAVLGLREDGVRSPLEQVLEYFQGRTALLVLDNCEHLIDACARLAGAILAAGVRARIVATSREALRLPGEAVWPVPGLATPDPARLPGLDALAGYDAVRLFLERARAQRPGFALTLHNAGAVAEICRRLDGIPLALELAAARVRALPPEQLAARLDDALRLLTAGSRTAPTRQQTLRATLDWSYALLAEPERVLLRRFAPFAGGWTLAAAEAVGAGGDVLEDDVLDLLAGLIDKSLVGVEEGDNETRYRLLEPVRQYAQERLDESREAEATRGRHAAYFLALAERALPGLRGERQAEALARLESEYDNLRAAIGWSLRGGDPRYAAWFGWALGMFWVMRSRQSEGRRWMEQALAPGRDLPAELRAKVLWALGTCVYSTGDGGRLLAIAEEGAALSRQVGDEYGEAAALGLLGFAAILLGDLDRAAAVLEEGLRLLRGLGDEWGAAHLLSHLAVVPLRRGDYAGAARHAEEAAALARRTGDRVAGYVSLLVLGQAAHASGERERAAQFYGEALTLAHGVRASATAAYCLQGLAGVASARGEAERVARLLGAAEVLLEGARNPVYAIIPDRALYDGAARAARAQLGERAWAAAWEEGRALTLDGAVAEALGNATPDAGWGTPATVG